MLLFCPMTQEFTPRSTLTDIIEGPPGPAMQLAKEVAAATVAEKGGFVTLHKLETGEMLGAVGFLPSRRTEIRTRVFGPTRAFGAVWDAVMARRVTSAHPYFPH